MKLTDILQRAEALRDDTRTYANRRDCHGRAWERVARADVLLSAAIRALDDAALLTQPTHIESED